MDEKQIKSAGQVLLFALGFLFIFAIGAALLFHVSSQRKFKQTNEQNRSYARMVAESGVHYIIAAIQRGEHEPDDEFDKIRVSTGTAQIWIDSVDVDEEPSSESEISNKIFLLKSLGAWNGETMQVGVIFRYTQGSGSDGSDVDRYFDGSVFCDQDLNMSGNANIDLGGAGSVHANGEITLKGSASFVNVSRVSSSMKLDMSGGNARIYGAAVAPQITLPSWAKWQSPNYFISGGGVEDDVERKEAWIDTEPYRRCAGANDISGSNYENFDGSGYTLSDSYISEGEMKNANKGVSFGGGGVIIAPAGGVLWIEGDVTFAGSCIVKGCVIATGDIKVQGGMTHESVNEDFPSFVSLNGDVKITSSCEVYGLVYADQGNIDVSGAATVHGAYLARNGSFSNSGGGSVIATGSLPTGPNGEDVTFPNVSAGGVTIIRWVK